MRSTFAGQSVGCQRVVVARASRAGVVMVEAKRPKASEYRSMSAEAIDAEVEKCRRALLDLRFKQRTRQASGSAIVGRKSGAFGGENPSKLLFNLQSHIFAGFVLNIWCTLYTCSHYFRVKSEFAARSGRRPNCALFVCAFPFCPPDARNPTEFVPSLEPCGSFTFDSSPESRIFPCW